VGSRKKWPGDPAFGKPISLEKGISSEVETLQRIAAEQQSYALKGISSAISREGKVEAAVTVHRNRDGTVDGELRVYNIRRGYTIDALLIDLEHLVYGMVDKTGTIVEPSEWRLPKGHFLSIGALTDWGTREEWKEIRDKLIAEGWGPDAAAEEARKRASPLPRYKGLGRVAMYPQRLNPRRVRRGGKKAKPTKEGGAHIHFKAARERLFHPQEGKRHKPQQILIRFYWNHEDKRPGKR
jgi:hypothetical protein